MKLYQSGVLNKIGSHNADAKSDVVPIVHHSDAIRIALIYKYGGWYSDLDMVFLKSIKNLRNVLGSDYYNLPEFEDPDFLGRQVSNAIFHFDKGHLFLDNCLKLFSKTRFRGSSDILNPGYSGAHGLKRIRSYKFIPCNDI